MVMQCPGQEALWLGSGRSKRETESRPDTPPPFSNVHQLPAAAHRRKNVEPSSVGGFSLGRFGVQGGEEFLRSWGRRHRSLKNDVLGTQLLAVQILVAPLVGPEGGAFKRDAREETTGTGIGENLGSQGSVGCGCCITALGTGGGRSNPHPLILAGQNALRTAGAHEKQNKVRGLPAALESDAPAFQRDDGWRAPGSSNVFTGPAGHDAATIASTAADGNLNDGGKHNDAFCFIAKILGKAS